VSGKVSRWPHVVAVPGKKSANDLLPKIPAALEETAGERDEVLARDRETWRYDR
jgi:hypothetical protein